MKYDIQLEKIMTIATKTNMGLAGMNLPLTQRMKEKPAGGDSLGASAEAMPAALRERFGGLMQGAIAAANEALNGSTPVGGAVDEASDALDKLIKADNEVH
jgi:hypothetical protein